VTRFPLAVGALTVAAMPAALAPVPARAQATGSPGGAVSGSAPITLVTELPAGSRIDEGQLAIAIARELGVRLVRERGAGGGTLIVRQGGDSVTVTFEGPAGRRNARTFALQAGAVTVEHEVALVAVNVARDQTAPFLIATAPAPPESPSAPRVSPGSPSAPAPREGAPLVTTSPCALLRASGRGRSPLGIDFFPYAGTSAFDGSAVRDVSIGLLGAWTGGVNGVAVSGLVNADGPVCGAEIAGVVNVAARIEGAQIGGVANVVSGDSAGVQIGLVDVAAGSLRGAQIGLVNTAHGANVQVGLVNVASDADVQVGLVNVDWHGRLAFDAWSKPEAGTVLLGVKHGPAHVHSIYALEMNAATGRPWAVFGLGAHLTPVTRLFVDIDLLQHAQLVAGSTDPNELSEARVLVGYELLRQVSAFAGPTYNVLVASDPSRADAPGYASLLPTRGQTATRAWPGVALGVEVP